MLGILVVVSACGNATEEKQLETGQNVKQENGNRDGLQSETTNSAFNANFEKYLSISVYLGVIGDYKFTDIGLVQKDTTKNHILVEVQGG